MAKVLNRELEELCDWLCCVGLDTQFVDLSQTPKLPKDFEKNVLYKWL